MANYELPEASESLQSILVCDTKTVTIGKEKERIWTEFSSSSTTEEKFCIWNFSGCTAEEVLTIIAQSKEVIKTQAPKSLFMLTDVTNAGFNNRVSEAMKEFARHNKPYVAAAAVVGVTGLKQIIFNAVMKFSGRHLSAFDTLDQAKDWLARQ